MLLSQKITRELRDPEMNPEIKVYGKKVSESGVIKNLKTRRVTRESFKLIHLKILPDLVKTPTPMEPNAIPPETQLALKLYRLAYGCSLSSFEDNFG